MVLRLVAENAKQRFELFYGYDPSPPRPKVKKGQGKGKGKGNGKGGQANGKANAPSGQAAPSSHKNMQTPQAGQNEGTTSPALQVPSESKSIPRPEVDAAALDDLSHNLSETKIHIDLPLVELPIPDAQEGEEEVRAAGGGTSEASQRGEYFIRATQGHSIKLEDIGHLQPVLDDDDGRARAGVCVHGTKWELWDVLSEWPFSSHLVHPLSPSIPCSLFY